MALYTDARPKKRTLTELWKRIPPLIRAVIICVVVIAVESVVLLIIGPPPW
jgi:hypothetical protein